jgi:hypothetical protein
MSTLYHILYVCIAVHEGSKSMAAGFRQSALVVSTVTITCFLRMKVWYFPSGFLCLLGNHQLGTMALLIACRVCCDAVAGTERQVYHVFLHAKR